VRLLLLGAVALLVARPAGGGLHGAHPCPDATGYTCSTLDVPLDHTGHVKGTLQLAVGTADNDHAPRGVCS